MNTKNFLIATIKVPVKVSSDGEIIMLDDYAEISVEPLTTEPRQTFDSISEKIIEYVYKNPEYLTSIVQETETFDQTFDNALLASIKSKERDEKDANDLSQVLRSL